MRENQRTNLIRLTWAGILASGTILTSGCQVPNGTLRQRALEAMQTGRIELARSYLLKATDQDPGDGRAQFYLGKLYLRVNQPLEAQLALEQALIQLPDASQTPQILDLLAEALYRQDEPAKLFTMLERASEQYDTTHDYSRQGDYLAKIGDTDNAMLSYRKATELAVLSDVDPYLKMADFLETLGDRRNTVKVLRQAYALVPDHPGLADRLRSHGVVPGPTVALPKGEEP